MTDKDDRTVLHIKHRSDHPPAASTNNSDEPPASLSTRAENTGPIEPFDDITALVDEMRKPSAERLEEQGVVASGGMGTVHLVVDRAIGRRMAMKTMHTMLREDDRMLRLFLREARTTGLLDHPNIVPVYDVGQRDGALYFTMKLVSGRTLRDVMRQHPHGVTEPNVLFNLLDVIIKMCDALAFAHSRGVIHCDIKPANVMMGDFGEVYLMDWGIARVRGSHPERASFAPPRNDEDEPPPSNTGDAVLGTASYMSPEQAEGNRVLLDARSDVFSVGAVLYDILCGRPPYRGASYDETLLLARNATYVLPSEHAGEGRVAPELERIVLKAMARHRSERYPDTDQLKADVLRYIRGGADFPQTTFAKGTVIMREGDEGHAAYIIASGQCEVRKTIGGVESVLKTLGPGEVFGEMAVLTEGPRTATVVATEDTTALVVTRGVMEHELALMKPWVARLLGTIAERFRDLYKTKRVTLTGGPSAARLANQLLMHFTTFAATGERLSWSKLSREIEAQMGATPHTIHMVVAEYPGIVLDIERDEIALVDAAAFRARVERDIRGD
jgi:CRP-like cAMP-binding protein/tRNA A-37 threonylcarbamoyl transferase component Bud32